MWLYCSLVEYRFCSWLQRTRSGNCQQTVTPGQVFQVTVNFSTPASNFGSIGVSDLAPSGWNVTVNETACTPAATGATAVGNDAQFIWITTYANRTAMTTVYQVTVPSGATPEITAFQAVLSVIILMESASRLKILPAIVR